MSQVLDPVRDGLARGWRVLGGPHAPLPERLTADVAIIGSGAGAGITAELLTAAGLSVVIIEEGPLRSSADFKQRESDAYPALYQDSASRKTADKGISILQGRCVGGSTTVNWTSSFRTPPETLAFWRAHFALPQLTEAHLAPFFAQAEERLHIGPWLAAPNANNQRLADGAARLGITAAAIQRNVKGCWNLGSCGLGCPTNAKQSMLVTTLPTALDRGATLLVQTRAQQLVIDNSRVTGVTCLPVALNGAAASERPTRVLAAHVVLAAGAINGPALLLRSGAPDPHKRLGVRTFLHPVVASAAVFGDTIDAWAGAPQTIYSDHFLHTAAIDGPIGYKLEAPPLHPVIAASTFAGFGAAHTSAMQQLPHTQAVLALMRDGFHPQSTGGTVGIHNDGSPVLDYPLTDPLFDAARRAYLSMAEIQFAAGACSVTPVHELATPSTSWAQARTSIAALPQRLHHTRVLSAHVMGGCGMAGRAELGVVQPDGRHWQLQNLSVHDGSLFPTSIGANPQLSVYGLSTLLATQLAHALTGRHVRLG